MPSHIMQRLLSDDTSILTTLTDEDFDNLFADQEYMQKFGRAKTEEEVELVLKEYTLGKLVFGDD